MSLPQLVLIMAVLVVLLVFLFQPQQARPRLSGWAAPQPVIGVAKPVELQNGTTAAGSVALDVYNEGSALQEHVAGGRAQLFRRAVGGGEIVYMVAELGDPIHIQVINADGATPTSDATGDTMWSDGGRHLATVHDMVAAPYSQQAGMELLGAMAFGYHGDARTSDEGTVVINGTIHRVNAWRGTLCIDKEHQALIGILNAEMTEQCQQAIGGGPVILWNNKVVNTTVEQETDEFLPFNPLNEGFSQLDWRKMIYDGTYPKTAVGIGTRAEGGSFVVLAVSYDITGMEFATQLKAMGCSAALGGDDDTSTQAVWRGAPLRQKQVRAVPDAIALYLRK